MQDIYDIICHLGLLKNRKQKDETYDGIRGIYNNTSFKSNIMTESGRQGFVSAGFARVKRPNEPIALTVLYHLCRGLLLRMKGGPEPEVHECLTYFGLNPEAVSARADLLAQPGASGRAKGYDVTLRQLCRAEADEHS